MADTTITTVHSYGSIETALTHVAERNVAFSDQAVAGMIDEAFGTALSDSGTVFSLDVFDTLLLRDNSSEMSRFLEIGARMAAIASTELGQEISPYRAFLLRDMGTRATYRAARKRKGSREGSLIEIHSLASRLLCGDARLAEAFIDAELEFEATTLSVNKLFLKHCEMHAQKGGRVILVSDMYMHVEHIKSLLGRLGLDLDLFGDCTSSADQSVTKASGLIFDEIAERMGVAPGSFFHIGDSWRGDYYQPCQNGWRAMHLPLAKADIEKRRDDHLKTAQKLSSEGLYVPPIAMPH